MSQFPAEIFGQIANELCQRDLWSLSQVSPATVNEANRILYKDVDFSSLPINIFSRDPKSKREQDKPIDSFFRTVSNSPHLASFVRAFAFRTPYQPDSDIDAGSAIRSLTNLRQLSITSTLSSDRFPSFLHSCALNLQTLHAQFPLDLDFLTFIKARPAIQIMSFGRDKMPTTVPPCLFPSGKSLLPVMTNLSVVEGAVRMAAHCPSVTHLDIRMSERQTVATVMKTIKAIGSQLVSLTWHQSLFYGSEAIVQCLPQIAELTPNLQSLEVVEHFCGGWANPPCAQYVADVEAMDLAGCWPKLESIVWKSHLSNHDHLVYWTGSPLCDRAFAQLPSLVHIDYSEDGRSDIDSHNKTSYDRDEFSSKVNVWKA